MGTEERMRKTGIWAMSRLIEMQMRPQPPQRLNSLPLSKISVRKKPGLGVQSLPGWNLLLQSLSFSLFAVIYIPRS